MWIKRWRLLATKLAIQATLRVHTYSTRNYLEEPAVSCSIPAWSQKSWLIYNIETLCMLQKQHQQTAIKFSCFLVINISLASFPGPAQHSVTCSFSFVRGESLGTRLTFLCNFLFSAVLFRPDPNSFYIQDRQWKVHRSPVVEALNHWKRNNENERCRHKLQYRKPWYLTRISCLCPLWLIKWSTLQLCEN